MSCTDIIVAAYWGAMRIDPSHPEDPARDRFILSKGHAATALYAALAYRGFFPIEMLTKYNEDGGTIPEHPAPHCLPGVEVASGSLGHGLGLGLGMALAGRLQKHEYRIFVCMSDGECNEGTVWEAAMFAPAHQLDNVCVIVDYNRWQATGRCDEVMSLSPLDQKFAAFGWSVYNVDGHDVKVLFETMAKVPDGSGKPVAIIAHTIKGKGVSFMEDDNDWHYIVPTAEHVEAALSELGLR